MSVVFVNIYLLPFMKIAITGSLGLIGSSLIDALGKVSSLHLMGFDIRYNKSSINYLDVTDKSEVIEKLSEFDVIIHLAAIARVVSAEKNPTLCNKVNIDGTQNIIDACLRSQKKPYLIFASSREVYGNQDMLPVSESNSLNPINVYAKSKLACEELISKAYKKGLKTFILRFTNVFGGMFDYRDRVVPSFSINALKNQDIKIRGNETILDFIFIDDVVSSISKAINYRNENHQKHLPIANISTGRASTLGEFAKIIIKVAGSNSKIVSLPKVPFAVDKFCGNNALAVQLLGWQPKFDLERGINKFIEELKNKSKRSIDLETINIRIDNYENFKSYSWLPAEI